MSFGPTARCIFCGGIYYLQKLGVHESICSSRPKKLTIGRAVRMAIQSHPQASKDSALLIRLVWQIMDGYHTQPPPRRLTDPVAVMRAFLRHERTDRARGKIS